MLRKYFVPALMAAALLTGCQAPQGKFTPEQVAAMKSYGFTESNGDWSLGLSDSILFDKNDYRLRPDSRQQITTMASRLAATGITHSRLEGHTDNYGEDSYNEALSLKRANSVADCLGGRRPCPAQSFSHPRPWQEIPDRQQRHGGRAR